MLGDVVGEEKGKSKDQPSVKEQLQLAKEEKPRLLVKEEKPRLLAKEEKMLHHQRRQ